MWKKHEKEDKGAERVSLPMVSGFRSPKQVGVQIAALVVCPASLQELCPKVGDGVIRRRFEVA